MDQEQKRYLELSTYYRRAIEGHVFIRETLEALFEAVTLKVKAFQGQPRVLELGGHAGITAEWLLERVPELNLTVHDDDEELAALGTRRLGPRGIRFRTAALESIEPVDIVYSIARHHHLPHDYLRALRRCMKPAAVYLVADELCPEYCNDADAARLRNAEILRVAGGYLLTTNAEANAFEASGRLPAAAVELEDRRRRALWRWYRFVVDQAIEKGYFDIAAGELRSASDDMMTGSNAEHKFSPLVVERQFELAGFRLASKRLIGPPDEPEKHSFFVHEYRLA